ncbi:MAG: hypothetical protein JST26_15285 [Bacteroidetes bacterium]|nr:hypothetical protein [Bacteroidota bacterium]
MARFTLKHHLVVLLVLLTGIYLFYGYADMFRTRPHSIHQWRQTDCLSFTKNYYEEGMHFFSPKIHWQGDGDGKAVSELPLMNYSVAMLWKMFGEHEYWYRFLELFIYTIALLFLFAGIYETSRSWFYAYCGTLLIVASPLLSYYSFNFLADVPALSFAIIGLSSFLLFMHRRKMLWFIIAIIAATLAALLKASAGSVLIIIGVISLCDLFNIKTMRDQGLLFPKKIIPLIAFPLSAILILAWYRWALAYNNNNSDGVFLMGFLPIWKMEPFKILETARFLVNDHLNTSFNKAALFLILGLFIWLLLNLKKLEMFVRIALIISALFTSAFILLFFKVFNVHDYYLITQIIFPIMIIIGFGSFMKSDYLKLNKKLNIIIVFFLAYSVYYSCAIFRLRTFEESKIAKTFLGVTNEEASYWRWFHWNYDNTIKPLEEITPYLRSLGIQRTDKVVSIPDQSFNITLYLMDQKGFTGMGVNGYADTTFIKNDMAQGAKYLVINNPEIKKEKGVEPYLKNKIGQFKHVEIYKLEQP